MQCSKNIRRVPSRSTAISENPWLHRNTVMRISDFTNQELPTGFA